MKIKNLFTLANYSTTFKRFNCFTIHRDEMEALDLNEVVTEFVSRSQIRRNKFGVQVQKSKHIFILTCTCCMFVCSVVYF